MASGTRLSKKTVTRCPTSRYQTWHIDQSREIFWKNWFNDAQSKIFDYHSRSSSGIHGQMQSVQERNHLRNKRTGRTEIKRILKILNLMGLIGSEPGCSLIPNSVEQFISSFYYYHKTSSVFKSLPRTEEGLIKFLENPQFYQKGWVLDSWKNLEHVSGTENKTIVILGLQKKLIGL